MHQHHRHQHAAQHDVGQNAPSLATSPAARRLCASRNHTHCEHPKPTTPAALCVSSAGAPAGTQAQEETHLLSSARRAQSRARNCLCAAHCCCDIHGCELLLVNAVRHHLIESRSPQTQARLHAATQPSARNCPRAAHRCCNTHCCMLLLWMQCRRVHRSSFNHRETLHGP